MTSNPAGDQKEPDSELFTTRNFLIFLLPSLVGIGMFLIPFTFDGSINVGMGILADLLMSLLGRSLPAIAVIIFWISSLITVFVKTARPDWAEQGPFHEMFHVGPVWLAMRLAGTLLATLTLLQTGPEFITADITGGLMLNELITVLLAFFLFAAIFLPFLVDYGFMEFIGSLVRKPFRLIFNLPGRSAIDATASWFGSGTVGVLITMQQYQNGYYSRRESAVIATNFSVVSIAFSLVIINFVDLNHMFLQYYGTVVVAGIIAAVVLPRLLPLCHKPDTYYEPVGQKLVEEKLYQTNIFMDSLFKAMARAKKAPGPAMLLRNSMLNVADIFFSLLPLVFAIGISALILAEFTPLFMWLSYPMIPLLQLLQIPEAHAAAPATLIGFADMFIPAVLAAGIESDLTRFVIAALSVSQLIYMSEVGALILKSKIPLNLWELILIFILRTLITLPVITIMAHLLFF
ncbi:YjiH family protein [Natronogracilivirga saccharolytica]|uniref:YjiH family protein n=1 Tax=Natronogracilivirga saccharolytica TaxID=2812953 RepID=A0A8J7RGE3_9BACT|nr:YjiH family protein [Natronogracilivirga saccharolytica]MBP3191395.1 YjiH family protein [Natronogracilivirga saccharolytica]